MRVLARPRRPWLVTIVSVLLWSACVTAITWEEYDRIFPASKAVFLETQEIAPKEKPDPATDATYKDLSHMKVGKPISLGDEDVPAWPKKKKLTLTPTTNAIRTEDLHRKLPELNKQSLQVADPSKIKRECPKQRCPANVKCFDPTYFCCKAGNFSFCCPAGSLCLDTDPPSCLKEPKDDPDTCTTEVCKPDFHCPLSKVGVCCTGGETCCPDGARCVNTNPPTCKKMSHWKFLNQRQGAPQKVIKKYATRKLTKTRVPFARHPIPVIPSKLATRLPQKKKPSNTPLSASPSPLNLKKRAKPAKRPAHSNKKRSHSFECKECEKSLFTHPPTGPGTRTKQKSYIKDNKRITITETQKTVALADGRLKTKTKRHSVWSKVDPKETELWPEDTTADLQQALSREHDAAQLTQGAMEGKHYEHLEEHHRARAAARKQKKHTKTLTKVVHRKTKKFVPFSKVQKKQWDRLQQWGNSIAHRKQLQMESLRAKRWAWVAKYFPKQAKLFPHTDAAGSAIPPPVITSHKPKSPLKQLSNAIKKTKYDPNVKRRARAKLKQQETKRKKPKFF